ncbi:MAG: HPr family phosphocarrier protein [Candidatus Omnitrophica bacterium]|nr:HPr family phosphocarrier protein [Candidatus Omnitrophota bacterium]
MADAHPKIPATRRTVKIQHRLGLHARPAALFVQLANRFESEITVVKGRRRVNGKSIMGLLTLAAGQGSSIRLEAQGGDALAAVEALAGLVTQKSKAKTAI